MELVEDAFSGTTIVDELIADLIDDVLDNVDVNIAGIGTSHFSTPQILGKIGKKAAIRRIEHWSPEMRGLRWSAGWSDGGEGGGDGGGGGGGRRGEEETGGGTETENKEWNINRFASVYMREPTWRDLITPTFRFCFKEKLRISLYRCCHHTPPLSSSCGPGPLRDLLGFDISVS